jgi:hypothetical protein
MPPPKTNYTPRKGSFTQTRKVRGKRKTRKVRDKRKTRIITDSRYQTLILKKKSNKKNTSLSKRETQQLDAALYAKYCACLKKFEVEGKSSKGYPICMNSVYLQRRFTPPPHASTKCNVG